MLIRLGTMASWRHIENFLCKHGTGVILNLIHEAHSYWVEMVTDTSIIILDYCRVRQYLSCSLSHYFLWPVELLQNTKWPTSEILFAIFSFKLVTDRVLKMLDVYCRAWFFCFPLLAHVTATFSSLILL